MRGERPIRWRALAGIGVRRVRDVLVIVGIAGIGAVLWLYAEGRRVTSSLEDGERQRLARIAFHTLDAHLGEALQVRVPVNGSAGPAIVLRRMHERAAALELDPPVLPETIGDSSDSTVEAPAPSVTLCADQIIAEALTAHPALVALASCRVTLHRDTAGERWLSTLDLAALVAGGQRDDREAIDPVLELKDRLLQAMVAGAGATE